MATKVETAVEVKPVSEDYSEATKKLIADTTVVSNVGLQEKITALDNLERTHDKQQGGKWAVIAEYAINNKLTEKVILKSLIEMGKTEKSAYSIRTRIMKIIKYPDLLAGLKAGSITQRQARNWNRKVQVNPSRNDQDRFDGHIRDAGRYAGALGMSRADFLVAAEKAFDAYATSEANALAQKAANKS